LNFLEVALNGYFLFVLALAVLFIWTVGSYSFWRISRSTKARLPHGEAQPAYRLAEQWLSESQKKLENLYQNSEQPLGTAQNELLELRLEAGRLPQGVKSLKTVRESLEAAYRPQDSRKSPLELARLYLDEGAYRTGEDSLLFLKTPLGEMPCLGAGKPGSPLAEDDMKSALGLLSRALSQNPSTGGFLYLGEEGQYQACLQKPEWMEGLKSQRLTPMDYRGLTALLLSLRLAKDAEKVLEVFGQGVEATRILLGQSEKMGAELSRLSSHSLKIQAIIEGGAPTDFTEPKE
jgi:hypothetical protein